MTKLLLEALPAPPAGARILDFCCGSGAIAAAMGLRAEDARLHLLDADAVALEAARANVPQAKKLFLSDAWASVPESTTYDWILSNPPVHLGLQCDFTVLTALLAGGPPRLRTGGALYLVAQTYVPVGLLAPEASSAWTDGRFTVWRLPPSATPRPTAGGSEG
mmetsp:Transcript_156047/g.500437  ORF Transcript_156047/g.500437 Transcript_156047/m.500437 type:complete len:163 (+) Transcript_156047:1260-1748(+)